MYYKDVKIGQIFEWCKHSFTKLNDNLCIINPSNKNNDVYYCCFDNIDNDYELSLIRHFINNRYLGLLGLDTSSLEFNKGYCELLSIEEYRKYKDIIPSIGRWYWLRSPDAVNSNYAYVVYYDGDIHYINVNDTNAVRAAFILKSDTIVSLIY